jgi:thiamine biosynthesis lipoprotein
MSQSQTFSVTIPNQANPSKHPNPILSFKDALWIGQFQAMASDCQILLEGINRACAEELIKLAAIETWRIEHKFSRYKTGNVMDHINHAYEERMIVDDETTALLNFADQCYRLSEGLFDVTAGVLRKIWRFDGSSHIPIAQQINEILPFIGWHKVDWKAPYIQLPKEMELDLGGIGKEYAVDKVCLLLQQHILQQYMAESKTCSILVNFGGDLACSGPRLNSKPWEVAVESYQHEKRAALQVKLSYGGIATSGDSRRFLLKDGIRYSHILNPKTGQAIIDAPHSVSVAASSCMQAGILSTMAMLQGEFAEDFLKAQEADFWVQRS